MGRRTLRNRIALTSTTTNYGAGNRVTDRFLAERAKGGGGMIITEIVAVDPAALPGVDGDRLRGRERRRVQTCRRCSRRRWGLPDCSLLHPGRQQLWSPVVSPKGISDRPDAYSWTVPHVMTTTELLAALNGGRANIPGGLTILRVSRSSSHP
jgi:dimethylglycine catabolism A